MVDDLRMRRIHLELPSDATQFTGRIQFAASTGHGYDSSGRFG
jgi:hypothetical protein